MKKKINISKDRLVKVDILDVLLDENNTSNIFVKDKDGNSVEMEQIAVVPYGEDELYAILKPAEKMDGVDEEDVVVFRVDEGKDGKGSLVAEQDFDKASEVFKEYYKSYYEEGPEGKNSEQTDS